MNNSDFKRSAHFLRRKNGKRRQTRIERNEFGMAGNSSTIESRGTFSSRFGFVMAAASSAIGLGNLWRFPYLAAQYGGGTFLFIYVLLAFTFGYALMITEIALGRKTGLSALGAFRRLDRRFAFCGILGALIPAIIAPYYGVIGGWVTRYALLFCTGGGKAAAESAFFGSFISSTYAPIAYFGGFTALSGAIVLLGVEKGIERAGKTLMPSLLVLTLCIACFTVTRPGAWAGVIYMFRPDFSCINGKTLLAALGQLFYSLSVATGIMITYGSYMKSSEDISKAARHISFCDSIIAILAGLMIIPAIFVFSGGGKEAVNAGPGLMFITLPKVFAAMPLGSVIGAMFFFLTFFAALTSHISLTECIVANVMDTFHLKRRTATVCVSSFAFLAGVPSSLGFGLLKSFAPLGMDLLTFFDFISNSVLMPLLALVTCIFAAYILSPRKVLDELQREGVKYNHPAMYSFMVKYAAPVGIVSIWASSVAAGLGFFSF